jgi:hypothetical protein
MTHRRECTVRFPLLRLLGKIVRRGKTRLPPAARAMRSERMSYEPQPRLYVAPHGCGIRKNLHRLPKSLAGKNLPQRWTLRYANRRVSFKKPLSSRRSLNNVWLTSGGVYLLYFFIYLFFKCQSCTMENLTGLTSLNSERNFSY